MYRTYLADGTKTGGECGSWKLYEPQDEEIFGGLFLSIFSRRGERWKDVHENEPTLKVYTATKRWRSSCFQSGTWLKVMMFCFVILFRFCFCSLIIICFFYFTKKEGSINCSVISNQTKKKGVNFQLVCWFANNKFNIKAIEFCLKYCLLLFSYKMNLSYNSA